MATKLKKLINLVINRVDLVDRGANQDANVVLFKRDNSSTQKSPTMFNLTRLRTHTTAHPVLGKAVDWLEQIDTGIKAAIAKQDDQSGDTTFKEVLAQRSAHRVMQRVHEFAMVLDETIHRIVQDTQTGKTEQKVQAAVAGFIDAVKEDLPTFIKESMKTLAKGDQLADVVTLIGTGEPDMTDKKTDKKVDKKTDDKKVDMSVFRKMLGAMAKAFGASDEEVAQLDPPVDDIWKGVSPALRQRIEASEASTTAEVAKREAAEKRVAKLERDATLRDVRKEVVGFKHMGLDPNKDLELFEKMTVGLDADQLKRMREVFKSVDEKVEAGALFAEMGLRGIGDVPDGDSADAEIEKRVTGLLAKAENSKMTRDQAMDAVLGADPPLYDRYRRENSVRAGHATND